MADKIRVLRSSILAQDSKNVTYTDEGGTLRKVSAVRAEIVDSMDSSDRGENQHAGSVPDQVPEPLHPATAEATEEAPPSSDKPPTESDTPAEKPKRSRKKDMATAQTSAAKKKAPPPKAKVAAKKSAPKPRTEGTGIRTIGGKAVNLDGYEKVKTPAGGTSYHNGDSVAEKLAGKTLDEVYDFAAKHLKEDKKVLQKKYAHLNTGMQRMSLGNRLRKVLIPKEAKN